MANPSESEQLSIAALRRIETACTRFETGTLPEDRDIAAILCDTWGDERTAMLCELAALDVELRRQRGQSPRSSDYANLIDDSVDRSFVRSHIESLVVSQSQDEPPRSERYEFSRRIGSGGVSTVWRVYDRQGQRPLAIKLLHARYRDDDTAHARLRREALLTGSLQHPGVPPVYDHGRLDDGNVFFAMKMVQGDTLESILKRRSPGEKDLPHCLAIFEQVSQTLAYAHSQGIIHRDLKPQNVMVGRFAEVQVMDWGMAKRLEETKEDPDATPSPSASPSAKDASPESKESSSRDTRSPQGADLSQPFDPVHDADPRHSLTVAGDVLGTPSYMPPEQARGEIDSLDRRSDVFGLGAMLFQILTHRRLYGGRSAAEVLSAAAAGDLAGSFEVLSAADVDRDLIELCRQCLSVDRCRRPRDAGDVARRIADHMAGVQSRLRQAEIERREAIVLADAEGKRRKAVAGMAALIVTLSLVGVLAVLWQWDKAVRANETANRALALADQRFVQAQAIVDDYLTEVAREDGVLARTPDTQSMRRALLQKARDYYQQFLAESADNPAVRYEAARAQARLGQITLILQPASAEAIDFFQEAIRLYEHLNEGDRSKPDYLIGIAEARGAIGNAHFAASRFQLAEAAYSDSAKVWADLVLRRGDPTDVLGLAKSTHNVGHTKSQRGDKVGAERFLVDALDLAIPLLASHGDEPEFLFHISNMHSNAGTFFGFKMRDWNRSLELYQTSVDLRERLVRLAPDQHRNENALAGSHNNIGLALYQVRRIDDALKAFETAAEIRERLIRENPAIAQYAGELGSTYTNLGTFSAKQGRPKASIAFFEKSAAVYQRLFQAHPQIISHGSDAIAALVSIAAVEPDQPRAKEVVESTVELYAKMLAVRPESTTYAANLVFFQCLLPESDPARLVQQSERFSLDRNPDARQLAIRALALFRDGQFQLAADHLESIGPEKRDKLTWVVSALVAAALDQPKAVEHLAAAREEITRKDYPDVQYVWLLQEATRGVAEMSARLKES